MIDDDWRVLAACRGDRPELFFPNNDASDARWAIARAVCHTCPVRDRCLDLAFDVEGDTLPAQRHGMFGGMTPDERAAEAKRRGIKRQLPRQHGTEAGYKQHQRRKERACDECLRANNLARRLRVEAAS